MILTAAEHADRAMRAFSQQREILDSDALMPTLEVWRDGKCVVMILQDRVLLRPIIEMLREESGGEIEALVFNAEIWTREAGDGPPPERGQLGRDFAAGDANVHEALTTVAVTRDEFVILNAALTRTDDGIYVAAPEVLRAAGGNLLDDMRAAWA
jgi:hypothetical protein